MAQSKARIWPGLSYVCLVRSTAGSRRGFSVSSLLSSLVLSSLELSDTQVYEPYIRALLGTASYFCEIINLISRTVPNGTTLSLRILRVIRRGAQAMSKRGAAGIPLGWVCTLLRGQLDLDAAELDI